MWRSSSPHRSDIFQRARKSGFIFNDGEGNFSRAGLRFHNLDSRRVMQIADKTCLSESVGRKRNVSDVLRAISQSSEGRSFLLIPHHEYSCSTWYGYRVSKEDTEQEV
ncbi:hypothetical protein AVEN_61616-1 [Araneus ventricosus]|uniref:Uncharacterized protein n=1 Tax=Araneus ventricosus TaxID=182803 RepID=A0A4Y2LJV8_ARAVE|nr:hypothetical protein AVEN_61616-1 [Araneus ventricosus]